MPHDYGDLTPEDIERIKEQRRGNLLSGFDGEELPPASLLKSHGIEIKADPPMRRPRPEPKRVSIFKWLFRR